MSLKKINLIDNTKTKYMTHEAYEKGISEYGGLTKPNQGETNNGDILHFFDWGLIYGNDSHWIDSKMVFLENGFLTRPGCIVVRHNINRKKSYIDLGDQEYFRVIESSVPEIPENSLVIAKERTSYKFMFQGQKMYFVQPDHIFLVFKKNGTLEAGPNYMILRQTKEYSHLLIESKNSQSGTDINQEKKYWFDAPEYEIEFKGKKFLVVNNKELKLFDD